MKVKTLTIFSFIIPAYLSIIPLDLQNGIKYLGINDRYEHYEGTIEGPNPVPNGAAYNSYIIIHKSLFLYNFKNKEINNPNPFFSEYKSKVLLYNKLILSFSPFSSNAPKKCSIFSLYIIIS